MRNFQIRLPLDFLAGTNHEGENIDFHALRHTYGAWLTMTGSHPKVVQTAMRHSSITLTMDTYGHLFPGQEADAVVRLWEMLGDPADALRATGTDNQAAEPPGPAQRHAQRAGRETPRLAATDCEQEGESSLQDKSPKPVLVTGLGDDVPPGAAPCVSSGGGTRTPDTRIMIPLL